MPNEKPEQETRRMYPVSSGSLAAPPSSPLLRPTAAAAQTSCCVDFLLSVWEIAVGNAVWRLSM